MSKKHLAYGGAAFALALFGIFGGILFHNGTPQAKAQDLVKNAITVVSSMSQADLDKLIKDQDFDLMASLKEAKQAKDLTTLTAEQFAKENSGPDGSGWGPGEFKYLKYTDANGNRVYLGLDANNVPHFKDMLMKDGTRKAMGEAQLVPDTGNPNGVPILNLDDLPAGSLQMVPGSGQVQTSTGSVTE